MLNLIRDVGSKVTTYWADAFTTAGSGALSVGMGGVLIIDKMLTAFAEEAQATKLEDMGFIYYQYNEGFTGFGHKPMSAKDWRQKVIQVLDKHPEDPEIAVAALEAGFNEYASQFFKLSLEQMNEVAADTPGVTVKRVPSLTEDEQQTLIDGYIAHLKDKTMPAVLKSVENYMVRKAEQSYITAMNAVRDYYNTKISISIKENIPEGQSSQYEGYQFRFAPLSETAAKGSWTGKWNKSGSVTSSATLIGFITAGLPHTVEFFAPDADLNTAEPEFTVPFVISAPDILIEFGGAPTFDELVGAYDDGTLTIESVFISDSLRSDLASGAYSEESNDYGCDIGDALLSLEEKVGVANEAPFTVEKKEENSGTLSLEGILGDILYDPNSGLLGFSAGEEGTALAGDLRAAHNGDKSGVIISGDLKMTFMFDESDFYCIVRLEGSKPLVK